MKKPTTHRTTQDALRVMHEAVLHFMQMPKSRRGMQAAFNATPSELGRIAVEAARKGR